VHLITRIGRSNRAVVKSGRLAMLILEDAAQPFQLTKCAGEARMAGEARTGMNAALSDPFRGPTEPELAAWVR